MNEEMLNLLIRSFDENLSEVERTSLDKALAGSPELREEKKQLSDMRQMIGETAERKFKPFFSARVMRRIEESQSEQEDFFRLACLGVSGFRNGRRRSHPSVFRFEFQISKRPLHRFYFRVTTIEH